MGPPAQLATLGFRYAKTNDVGRHLQATILQGFDGGAGVAVATFDAISQKDNVCLLIIGDEKARGLFDRGCQRRSTLGLGAIKKAFDNRQVQLAWWRNQLDVRTIVLIAMTVGQQSKVGELVPAAEVPVDDIARDFDFGDAVDLTPHGVGVIHNQNRITGFGGGGSDLPLRLRAHPECRERQRKEEKAAPDFEPVDRCREGICKLVHLFVPKSTGCPTKAAFQSLI